MQQFYLIWSIEHNGWWKDNFRGYTPDRSKAGQYTEGEAMKIVRDANAFLQDDSVPNEAMVPV